MTEENPVTGGRPDQETTTALWEGNAEAWTVMSRRGFDVCRDRINTPTFLAMLPDVSGLRGLDIGCGEGTNTRLVAARGASMTGLDVSRRFVEHARDHEESARLGVEFIVCDGAELSMPDESFDFVMSTMCLMDVPDPDAVLKQAYRVITSGGFLQFSITHPCFQTPRLRWLENETGEVDGLLVGDYFAGRADVEEWTFNQAPDSLKSSYGNFRVAHFHRTLSQWLNSLVEIGFILERLEEPRPDRETIELYPALKKLEQAAFFLHLRLRKA